MSRSPLFSVNKFVVPVFKSVAYTSASNDVPGLYGGTTECALVSFKLTSALPGSAVFLLALSCVAVNVSFWEL